MNNFLDTTKFTIHDGQVLASLAGMTEHGNSPVLIEGLEEAHRVMVERLLTMSEDDLRSSGISLWGNTNHGYVAVRSPINSAGYSVYSNTPSDTIH